MSLNLKSSSRSFGGEQRVYSHFSEVLQCEMTFGAFIPPAALEDNKLCPVLYYLSGLTCTHENFILKSGFQQYAAKAQIIVINPDTSPRNVSLPDENTCSEYGTGAGFYVDATEEPWSKHYKMFTYITKELIDVVNSNLPVNKERKSIMGHSMGGHGALICALKVPELFRSVSTLSAICNPINSKMCRIAFTKYFGTDENLWKSWDATELVAKYKSTPLEIFMDQGTKDQLISDLLPDNFLKEVSANPHVQATYRKMHGYDHGYYYVATVIGEHIAYHAAFLNE